MLHLVLYVYSESSDLGFTPDPFPSLSSPVFLLVENVYNLREENRQLRKAHQDIYTQLLDVQVRETTKDSGIHYVIRV